MVRSGRAEYDSELSLAELLEEIEEQLRAGKGIDLEMYRKHYLDLYEELAQLLPTLRRLLELGRPFE